MGLERIKAADSYGLDPDLWHNRFANPNLLIGELGWSIDGARICTWGTTAPRAVLFHCQHRSRQAGVGIKGQRLCSSRGPRVDIRVIGR